MVNEDDHPFKARCNDPEYAMQSDEAYGPTFGWSGGDLCIANDSDTSLSHSKFGMSYEHPKYSYPSCILAGSEYFQTIEIEIYRKV